MLLKASILIKAGFRIVLFLAIAVFVLNAGFLTWACIDLLSTYPILGLAEFILAISQFGLFLGVFFGAISFLRGQERFRLEQKRFRLEMENYRLAQEHQKRETARHISSLLYERAVVGFNEALNHLKGNKNSRSDWLDAEESLVNSLRAGVEIEDPGYKDLFETLIKKKRDELYDLLLIEDKVTNTSSRLPDKFFFGISDWKDNITLDQAYGKYESRRLRAQKQKGGILPRRKGRIDEQSIRVVFNFADPPEDYEGLRAESRDAFIGRKNEFKQGAIAYMKYCKEHKVF